jgi:endonuclease/exonuclease/phosphatase family metal-dependent hydrolase
MLRIHLSLFLGLSLCCSASAQVIGSGHTGRNLINHLRTQFTPTGVLSYKDARKKMFAEIDNRGGKVRCVYTGVEIATSGIPDDSVMNTEHTWPQSKFREKSPMKSDLFHLFPTVSRVNSERGNNPFGEIPDDATEFWWISKTAVTRAPRAADRDNFSESVDDRFEPREDHKGNVARAMLYFWVVYGNRDVTPKFIDAQFDTLLAWHKADPVDAAERARNDKIKAIQGNENPFILDPTLASRVAATRTPTAPPRTRPTIAVTPAVTPAATPAAAPAPATATTTTAPISLRIASWNMQSTMHADQPESDPEFLADLIGEKQGVHLWGLCEVADLDALREFERGAEEGENADYVAILGKSGGGDRLAVLYNATVLQPVGRPFELKRQTQLSSGLRASLVVKFKGKRTGQEFLFVVNHLKRGGTQNSTRLKQSENLNKWARGQDLPIIALGDFNYDYDPDLGHLGVPNRDGGFDALTDDGVFQWIQPSRLVKTQADDNFNSVLDFIFVANAPFGWTGRSTILEREGDQAATANDFDDDDDNTDHRPVDAVLVLDDGGSN